MTNLSFDTGTYKEYQLNGGETIRINVGDPGIIDRLRACGDEIDRLKDKYGEDIKPEKFGELDKDIRKMVDDAINCPGACDKAFGTTNCLAITVNGDPIIKNFFRVLIEQITKDMSSLIDTVSINESIKEQEDEYNILDNERTQKYIVQSKPQNNPSVQSINLAALSQEERSRLLAELLGEQK